MFAATTPASRRRRAAFAAVCAACAFSSGAGLRAAPRIEIPEPVFQFGWRDNSATVTNRFVLKNTGDATLQITDIRVSCGCSRATPERRVLDPGEETALDVRTNLQGFNGPIRKSVIVASNDPRSPYCTLWIKGEARASACLEPSAFSFGRIDPREPPAPATVRLAGYATNLTITAATSDNPAFPATVAADGRSLTLSPPQLGAPGAYRARMRVALSDPARAALTLSLYAWRDDQLRIVPSTLTFRAVPGVPTAAPRLITVRPGDASRFSVLQLRLDGADGTAAAAPRPDGSVQIRVQGVQPATLGTNAALVITTDLADHPDWRVPLRIEPSGSE
jgi:hypothetical protein